MLRVNNDYFSKSDFLIESRAYSQQDPLKSPEFRLYAICMKHPFAIISLIFYLREREGSVLLINGETPLRMAIEISKKAGCSVLIYGEDKQVIEINGNNHPDCPSIFQYTSGTTGEPKLIQRKWHNIQEELTHYNQRIFYSDEEPTIILVPVHHSFGLIAGAMAALERGSEPIIVTEKNPKFAIHLIKSFTKSITYGVPFLLHLLSSFKKDKVIFDRIIVSGASLTDKLLNTLKSCSSQVWNQYGCSEVGCISLSLNPQNAQDVGRPLGHIKLVMNYKQIQPQEIIVSYNNQEIPTNDLGYLSLEGSLKLLCRLDDVINVSGLMVIPSEVEEIIRQMPTVFEIVVYRGKHVVWGETVRAIVVPIGVVTYEEIKEWCVQRIPPYKIPSRIQFVTEIPRMPSGKISRKLLEEMESM